MTVGITGHQRLPDPKMWDWVASALETEISRIPKPLVGVTNLAIGADQLFARIVLKHGGRLVHIKPFADYERTFDANGIKNYRNLVESSQTEVLSVRGDDQDAYLAAGMRMVDLCSHLFAVWDGRPARGKGGTGDIVQYAKAKNLVVLHFNPELQLLS